MTSTLKPARTIQRTRLSRAARDAAAPGARSDAATCATATPAVDILLVGVLLDEAADAAGIVVTLYQAARRARNERRPLVVALAPQPPLWGIGALLRVLMGPRADAHLAAQQSTIHEICELAGGSARVLTLPTPFAWTRRGLNQRWRRQLAILAGMLGAELHPPSIAPLTGRPTTRTTPASFPTLSGDSFARPCGGGGWRSWRRGSPSRDRIRRPRADPGGPAPRSRERPGP